MAPVGPSNASKLEGLTTPTRVGARSRKAQKGTDRMQAHKPVAYLQCTCSASADFHYDNLKNTYTCRRCRRQVAGCTAKRKTS
jgi:hypothetical protein